MGYGFDAQHQTVTEECFKKFGFEPKNSVDGCLTNYGTIFLG